MIDESLILAIERLRDELSDFKFALRSKYSKTHRQVSDLNLKTTAARIAEAWIVNIAQRREVVEVIASDYLADLSVHFQRLLTLSEHASKRARYETEIKTILSDFNMKVIIPLKKLRSMASSVTALGIGSGLQPGVQHNEPAATRVVSEGGFVATAFVGYSFAAADKVVVDCVIDTLTAMGIAVTTGEKPRANKISDKVKRAIEGQYLFVGVFTKRDKIAHKKEWTTSPWVLDEKAYALGKGKKLILLKEVGVGSIGGIQGDYEFIEFARENLQTVPTKLMSMFSLLISNLRV
jgi:hypothetical protein